MEKDITILHSLVEKVRKQPVDIELVRKGATFRELGLDSLSLAELTVRIEQEYRVDVFADGVISNLAEVKERIGLKE